jgi:glutamate-ammonia-ligase adenylyltransferase
VKDPVLLFGKLFHGRFEELFAGGAIARLRERVAQWRAHPRVQALRDEARARLLRIVQRTGRWLAEGKVSEDAALRLIDWLEPLLRRESYLALLLERPPVHERLLHLLGAARWPARYMLQHPGVIDELAGGALLAERFAPADFERELQLRLTALASTGEDDDENLLNLLRRAHHAETFRTLARDVEQRITVEQVADDLSLLADSVLGVTARWCWQRLKNRHRPEPRFAIIGYGKLGGKELGYGSDLDIVFVFDDEDERASEIYAAFVRKLINWLTVKTGEGDLFEIDTELRPNGNSGLLVTSFQAYADYQAQRGSNTAWTWEHQAMTRARFVLGSQDLRARFDAVRESVITAPREGAALRGEIQAMRQRLHAAHPVPAGQFDVKHSPGGMLDVEFAVQYLVLSQSAAHPGLRENKGNIALLQRAEAAALLPEGVGRAAADAYRTLRQAQHRARLNEEPTRVPQESLAAERQAVQALWHAVFGADGA